MPETRTRVRMEDLFGGLAETTESLAASTWIPLAHIEADPEQPRRFWNDDTLLELAASIREQGILQPVIVRPTGRNRYMLVAGERRWRAAGMAGLERIPAVVKDVDSSSTRVMSLVENLQREDLRDEEKAAALQELKRLRKATWEEVGRWVGLSEPRVKALAQLNREPPEVQALMASGGLTEKHLSLTRTLKDERRLSLLREVARRGLSTQQTREAVELLRADDALSVAAALRTVRGLDGEGSPSRWGAERVYRYVRWFERFPDACDEAETPEMVEALAALEKQVRALRRRIAEAVG